MNDTIKAAIITGIASFIASPVILKLFELIKNHFSKEVKEDKKRIKKIKGSWKGYFLQDEGQSTFHRDLEFYINEERGKVRAIGHFIDKNGVKNKLNMKKLDYDGNILSFVFEQNNDFVKVCGMVSLNNLADEMNGHFVAVGALSNKLVKGNVFVKKSLDFAS